MTRFLLALVFGLFVIVPGSDDALAGTPNPPWVGKWRSMKKEVPEGACCTSEFYVRIFRDLVAPYGVEVWHARVGPSDPAEVASTKRQPDQIVSVVKVPGKIWVQDRATLEAYSSMEEALWWIGRTKDFCQGGIFASLWTSEPERKEFYQILPLNSMQSDFVDHNLLSPVPSPSPSPNGE